MRIVERTYVVEEGCPARQYRVTFELGGERRTRVASGDRSRLLAFNGRGYRPGSKRMLAAAVETFVALEAREQPLERINAELLHPIPFARSPRPATRQCADDRQLPPGDRS